MKLPLVTIYTDGSANNSTDKKGGWACVVSCGNHILELWGAEINTTNNRMEMLAAIRGLEALKSPCRVELYTDSQYVQNGINDWRHKWAQNKWKRKPPKEARKLGVTGLVHIPNHDLWKKMHKLCCYHKVSVEWVKGHAGNELNELCDVLAGNANKNQESGSKRSKI